MGFYQDRILPRLIDLAMRNGRLAPYRQWAISLAEGRVLEIGGSPSIGRCQCRYRGVHVDAMLGPRRRARPRGSAARPQA